MKVLFIRSSYGHPDSRLEKELYSLSKCHEVELLGWDRDRSYNGETESRIQINEKLIHCYHVGIYAPIGEGMKKMAFPMLRFWKKVWAFLAKNGERYDAVHACDFDAALPIIFQPKRPKLVYDIFDYYADSHWAPLLIGRVLRRLEGFVISKSDIVIICSEERKKQILPERPEHLLVIHNTPSDSMQIGKKGLDPRSKPCTCKIVYVGVLIEGRFLQEVCEVVADREDIELHIGGFGVLSNYISSMAMKYENIFFYGKLGYPETLDLERQCDVMTAIYDPEVPNHKYAAPNKFYEALMQKKPLVMIKGTGMDSYISRYDLGAVVDLSQAPFKEGFSKALDILLQQKEQWGVMGERGYRLYQTQFSWGKMEKRLLKAYEELGEA